MNLVQELRQRIAPSAEEEESNPLIWRERVLFALLSMSLVLGTISGVPSIWLAYRDGLYDTVLVDVLALAGCWVLTLHPRISFAWRTGLFLGIAYGVGLYFLFTVGLVSQIYLMAVPILTALLLGLRPALAALALVTLTLGGLGYLAAADLPMGRFGDTPALKFLLISLNFLFVDATLTISVAVLLRRLERSLERERRSTASRDRLAGAVAQAAEGIVLSDRNGRISYVNASATVLLGAATHLRFDTTETRETPSLPEAMARGEVWRGTVNILGDGGVARRCELTVTPLRASDRESDECVAILRDVTHEWTLEERLRRSEKLEALGTLSGGIAHDFNNIIGSILAVAEVARLQAVGAQAEALERIALACRRAGDIVRQMMAFSRQEVRNRRSRRLSAVVEETLPLLRASIPATITFETQLRSEFCADVDAAEIQQILLNLGSNAAQAMAQRNGGKLWVAVRDVVADENVRRRWPSAMDGASYVEIEVADTGIGIPSEHLGKIFDPFFTTKAPADGTGLGLASVHGIVRSLGGEVHVESVVNRGTTFRILLPTSADLEHASVSPAVVAEPAGAPPWQGAHALIVDDEPMLLSMLRTVLRRAGFEVSEADNVGAALEFLQHDARHVDLVVTDLSMPGGSGLAIIRAARERWPASRSILISGFGEAGSGADAAVQPDAFLQKPFTITALLATVAEVFSHNPGANRG